MLIWLVAFREHRRKRYAERWASPALMPNLVDRPPGRRVWVPVVILLASLAALIVGVARPHATVSVKREEATVLLTIDTSRSMGSTDISPSRLAAAQNAAYRFIGLIPEKFRIGVVQFSSRAQLAIAPTDDRELVRSAIASLHPGEGTAIGDAVVLSAELGQKQQASDGTIPPTTVLLISDGARDGGRTAPAAAAAKAKKLKVPVYTIVIGTRNGTVRHKLPTGQTEILRVPPSPQTLQRIAQTTGGQSYRAATDKQLKQVYDRLASRLGHRHIKREVSDLFAGGAALLLIAGCALSVLWFRRVA